jgi:hypothetical protein
LSALLVFNHHSLPFDSPEQAITAMPEFLKLCIRASNLSLAPVLIDESIDKNWFRLELAKEFYWQNWYKQNQKGNQDLIRAFRSIVTRQPFFSPDDMDDISLFDVSFQGNRYIAFRAAVWYDSPLVSFATHSPWNISPLAVTVSKINEAENLQEKSCSLLNLYSCEEFERRKTAFLKERNDCIHTSQELFSKRKEYYPALDFCGKSEEQFKEGLFSPTQLEQIKQTLTVLNDFCESWQEEKISAYSDMALKDAGLPYGLSGESDTVLNDPALRRKREFWLPSGNKKLFEKHIKLAQGLRIHFYPDSSTRTIYIGYMGKHLPTKKF